LRPTAAWNGWNQLDSLEIGGRTSAAHYVSDYDDIAGIRLPTKHRILPHTPEGQSLAEPLVVSIDLSEIGFT
jgi:hypothetical protein